MTIRRHGARSGASPATAVDSKHRRPGKKQQAFAGPAARQAGPPPRDPTSTLERLLQAAALEFNEHGFSGTDTNRIARRAGFAPQTFYRWFKDKEAVFIATYERWRDEQFAALDSRLAESASDARLAQVVVEHHKRFLVFRRSLRQLAVDCDSVRTARARSRLDQIEWMKILSGGKRDAASLAAMLLQIERLADALAEGEMCDMGLDESACEAALVRLLHELRS